MDVKDLLIKGAKATGRLGLKAAKAAYNEAKIQTNHYAPVTIDYQTPAHAPGGSTPKGTRVFRETYHDALITAEQKFEDEISKIAARAGANYVVVEGYDPKENDAHVLSKLLNKGISKELRSFTAGEYGEISVGRAKHTKIQANLYLYSV